MGAFCAGALALDGVTLAFGPRRRPGDAPAPGRALRAAAHDGEDRPEAGAAARARAHGRPPVWSTSFRQVPASRPSPGKDQGSSSGAASSAST